MRCDSLFLEILCYNYLKINILIYTYTLYNALYLKNYNGGSDGGCRAKK
jgi:hypothetical protein